MNSRRLVRAVWVMGLVAVACGSGDRPADLVSARTSAEPAANRGDAPAPRPAVGPRIVALGDSLTAGQGLHADEAYPAFLQQRLDAAGLRYEVVNAGVSGDTSAGGVRRLELALQGEVRALILALGANDGLRGLPVDQLRRNLAQMIEAAQAQGVAVILAGMEAPPNFGPIYVAEFRRVYPELAARYRAALVPFLLEGVAGVVSLNQPDGIHPTARGASLMADNVWAVLRPVLEQTSPRGRAGGPPGS